MAGARFREGVWGAPKLMEPGQVYEFAIDLAATSNLFRAGHRIRLDITSSSFPAAVTLAGAGVTPPYCGWAASASPELRTFRLERPRASSGRRDRPVVPASWRRHDPPGGPPCRPSRALTWPRSVLLN